MDIKKLDTMLGEQMQDLVENIKRQGEQLSKLASIEESYQVRFGKLIEEGHSRIKEIEHQINKATDIVDSAEKENDKIKEYLESLNDQVELYLKKIEDSNKLEIDDVIEGLKKVKLDIEEVNTTLIKRVDNKVMEIKKENDELKILYQVQQVELKSHKWLWGISFGIILLGLIIVGIVR